MRMHCNLRPSKPGQSFPALKCDAKPSLKSLNLSVAVGPYYIVFAADTLLYAVNFTFDPVTFTFDLWSWTLAVYRLWRDETLYQIWTQSSNLRRSYCDFNIWPNDLERRVACCARLWVDLHQVWPSTTFRAWIIGFFMLIRYIQILYRV